MQAQQTIVRKTLRQEDCYSQFSHLPHYKEDTENFRINHGLRTQTLGYQCPPSSKIFTSMDEKSMDGGHTLCMDARRLTEVSNDPSCGATARAQSYLVALEAQLMTIIYSDLDVIMATNNISYILPNDYIETIETTHKKMTALSESLSDYGSSSQSFLQLGNIGSSKQRVQSSIFNANPIKNVGSDIFQNNKADFVGVSKTIPLPHSLVTIEDNESIERKKKEDENKKKFEEQWKNSIRDLLLKQISLVLGLVVSSQPYVPIPIINLTKSIEKYIRGELYNNLSSGAIESCQEAVDYLISYIRRLAVENIIKPSHKISNIAASWIKPGDVIITFGNSHLVTRALIYAHLMCLEYGYDPIEVCILDSSCPKQSALEMVKTLSGVGVNCSYGLITAVNFFMKRATKVFTGAFEVNGDGSIVARAGTNIICEMAHRLGKPVIVLAEMFKFSSDVSTDASLYNCISQIEGVGSAVRTVCPMFDITPANRINVIVSERENIAPGSVSAVVNELDY